MSNCAVAFFGFPPHSLCTRTDGKPSCLVESMWCNILEYSYTTGAHSIKTVAGSRGPGRKQENHVHTCALQQHMELHWTAFNSTNSTQISTMDRGSSDTALDKYQCFTVSTKRLVIVWSHVDTHYTSLQWLNISDRIQGFAVSDVNKCFNDETGVLAHYRPALVEQDSQNANIWHFCEIYIFRNWRDSIWGTVWLVHTSWNNAFPLWTI